jgi:ribosomal protein S2
MVDTNSDPTLVDFAIPSNDDASKSISFITNYLVGTPSAKAWKSAKPLKGRRKRRR